ncbi:hypothetical protein PFAG_04293 [Plasmodium falciparum Santa Lucia]|uniref:AAR2 protein n=3 Tax=Plasmodium falciparum TaxID=5833 RepID=A0A024W2U6_PLAFA|nr:hypothetical protein PFTANZ_04260 [Plasmodium falciparum Tanzania (2000708)]EUR66739.1 hypothetical protein PFBG_04319 [Plasmodium falciparum 7G8]EUT81074.1 hypothetical protein PFAG_04293 [Plasmodium falciparum Santa Lucia]
MQFFISNKMRVGNNTGVVNDEKIYEDNNFIYNDKCSLVIINDKEINKTRKGRYVKRNNEIKDGSRENYNIKEDNYEDDNYSYDITNNQSLGEENTKEKFQEFVKNEGKENHMIKKEYFKLHIGFDYSNFSMDTNYKIIKFINKGSHFLYWNDDDIHFFDDTNLTENMKCRDDDSISNNLKWRDNNNNNKNNVRANCHSTKEYQMNEMKKNNCEEIRNSRFLYFDREHKLLVIKYNMKNNNFVYINEEDPTYKYFLNLHNKDFLDETLIKEKKDCILIYPYTYTKIWNTLTTYINDEVINKIEPVNKTFSSSFLKSDKDMINLHNQPYMFYSVIPKYSSKKKKDKKYVYDKNGRNNSKEKKEDNLEIDVQINDTAEKGDDNIIDISDDNVRDKYYVDITHRFNNSKNYIKEYNTINNTNVEGEKTYFEYISIDNETNKYTPSDITIMNMEKYWILKEIIQQEYTYIYYNNEQIEGFVKYSDKLFYILGEFQFAFILFHLGYNYQSFIQWRKLFELMTNSSYLVTNSTSNK